MSDILICIDESKVDLSLLRGLLEEKGHTLTSAVLPPNDPEATIRAARGRDIVISGPERWDERAARACRGSVRLVIRFGVGMDNIDIPALRAQGISVSNLPGYNAPAVAELALMHMLNLLRGFSQAVSRYRNGGFVTMGSGRLLRRKVVGLMGFGNIPRRLRALLGGFGCPVLALDPLLSQEDAAALDMEKAQSAEDLFSRSDIVSLHLPLTPETREIVKYDLLCLMRPGSFLVNTARGALINESDLLRAVEEGILAGAGLDVTQTEPLPPDSRLFKDERICITSHIGGTAYETDQDGQRMLAESIECFLAGGMPARTT